MHSPRKAIRTGFLSRAGARADTLLDAFVPRSWRAQRHPPFDQVQAEAWLRGLTPEKYEVVTAAILLEEEKLARQSAADGPQED